MRWPGFKQVLTTGCFDVLHIGHVRLLQFARNQGDHLVVGINSDASVRLLKGAARPINTAAHRIELLASLRCVDEVLVFEEATTVGILQRVKPKIWVKGGDYTLHTLNQEEVDMARALGIEIVLFAQVEGFSSSSILNKI
jgi:D-beta-D-heptose 7-phosphate kinase/D-beta-D-heptose 1-phosphate adenosyltransferase